MAPTSTFWPADYHLIAKDILRFHAIYWPALLLAADLELPRRLFVHGYLLMEGEKMSKSLGNVLDPFAVIERFGADALRFYLLRDVSFGQDGSVSTTAFEQRYESELANEYGNLASRTLAMVRRYRDGVLPAAPIDPELASDFEGLAEEVCRLLDRAELTQALDVIWQRVRRLNRYVEECAPWTLAKDEQKAGGFGWSARFAHRGRARGEPAAYPLFAGEHRKTAGCAGRGGPLARRCPPRVGPSYLSRRARTALPKAMSPFLHTESSLLGGGTGGGPALPQLIDSHTHLDLCEPPDTELVAAAERPG